MRNHIHSADSQRCHDDNSDSHDDNNDSNSFLQPDISIVMQENTHSITIDILDMLFIAFLDECEKHHGITPIGRGHSGLQLRIPYTSPSEEEQYGSLSLTFYPTTSRLMVQGTSYLLWVEEHLPVIYGNAETRYLADISSWRSLALHRGIGIKRDSRHRRDRHNNSISVSNTRSDSDRVLHCPADCRHSATASVADCTGTITASITEGCRHDNPSPKAPMEARGLMIPSPKLRVAATRLTLQSIWPLMVAHRMVSNPAHQLLRFAANLLTAASRPAIHLPYQPRAVPSLQPRLPHPVVVVALSVAFHLPHPLMEAPRLAPRPHHQGRLTSPSPSLPWAPPRNTPAHQENVTTQINLERNLRIRRLINLSLNATLLNRIVTWIVFEMVKLHQIWYDAHCAWPGYTSRVLVSMPSMWVYGRVNIVVDCQWYCHPYRMQSVDWSLVWITCMLMRRRSWLRSITWRRKWQPEAESSPFGR